FAMVFAVVFAMVFAMVLAMVFAMVLAVVFAVVLAMVLAMVFAAVFAMVLVVVMFLVAFALLSASAVAAVAATIALVAAVAVVVALSPALVAVVATTLPLVAAPAAPVSAFVVLFVAVVLVFVTADLTDPSVQFVQLVAGSIDVAPLEHFDGAFEAAQDFLHFLLAFTVVLLSEGWWRHPGEQDQQGCKETKAAQIGRGSLGGTHGGGESTGVGHIAHTIRRRQADGLRLMGIHPVA
ncbi:MAG: hypothetical protein VYE77_05360, partial [Planctomycetota bacterium]|nr:hypothetical protein [Planctomycetota bacterium]